MDDRLTASIVNRLLVKKMARYNRASPKNSDTNELCRSERTPNPHRQPAWHRRRYHRDRLN